MSESESVRALSEQEERRMCSRDGLWLRRKKDGGWRHNAARWTAKSCGQEPDPVTHYDYLVAHPWLVR
jgi:hypothetical protein